VAAGVLQGRVLGPILYTTFSSDMPLPSITQRRQYLQPHQMKMMHSTYADDTVIMCAADTPSSAVGEIQEYLHYFEAWAKEWSININASKTGHVIYTLRDLDERER